MGVGVGKEIPSRSQRSKEAFNEVSSLAPKPSTVTRGIDARALAAKRPLGSFTITRERVDSPNTGRPTTGYRGGPSTGGSRGGARTGRFQGRGGVMSRGGRGGRGGRARRGGNKQKAPRATEEDYAEEPYTDVEKAYLYNSQCGFPEAYNPTTSAESMAAVSPPVVSSSTGVNHTVAYKLQTASGNMAGNYYHAAKHVAQIREGTGLSFFEDGNQKAIANEWMTQDGGIFRKAQVGNLDQKAKEALTKVWVGGHYQAPKTPAAGDILGRVDSFLRRNETYLPQDTRKLEAKLSTLLPQAKPQPTKKARATV